MRIASLQIHAWTLPLRAPFAVAQRIAYDAKNVHIRVCAEDETLWGDGASAPVAYVTGETVESVLSALESVAGDFQGQPIDRLGLLFAKTNALLADAPAARAGLEMALYDLWGKHWRISLWQHFGGAQDALVTDQTIPLVAPEEAARPAAEAWERGFRVLKIKLGTEQDAGRIAEIVRAAPLARLRLDANQAFTPEGAVSFVNRLTETERAAIDLLEQPVPKDDIAGLRYVKEHIPFPLFADESAQTVADVLRLIQADAVDGINVKLMKSGITGALEIIALCRAAGKKLMLGCMLETGLGIAAAAQIAGGTGAFDFVDLDSHALLAPIPGLSGGFTCERDLLHVGSDAPGWGVTLPP